MKWMSAIHGKAIALVEPLRAEVFRHTPTADRIGLPHPRLGQHPVHQRRADARARSLRRIGIELAQEHRAAGGGVFGIAAGSQHDQA